MRSSHQARCSSSSRHCARLTLQRQPGERAKLVARVLEHVAQNGLQLARAFREHQAELGQEPPDAVDAGGAVFLEPLAQPVHAQHALLLDRLDRDVAHLRPRGCFADRCGIVGVVLAARTFHAVRLDQLRRDDARVQAEHCQLSCPVVRARARLHGDDAACGQANAPLNELVARQSSPREHAICAVDRVDLDHSFGQIHPYPHRSFSDNLVHGLPPLMA